MTRHVTRFTPAAQRDLRRIPLADARRILAALNQLQKVLSHEAEGPADVKAMTGRPGEFRLRVGDYRVIYSTEPDQQRREVVVWIWVLRAGHRREIYRAP